MDRPVSGTFVAKQRASAIASVRYFATRRDGPEAAIEDAVVDGAYRMFHSQDRLTCVFGSRQIGNGSPDLTIILCRPSVRALLDISASESLILGYLRLVSTASLRSLETKLQLQKIEVASSIERLTSRGLIRCSRRSYRLLRPWNNILSIVTVEAKHRDWKRAISQATRNTVFSNKSYVALPKKQAELAIGELKKRTLGIGVISVSDSGEAEISLRAHTQNPLVWKYYYVLASEAARTLQGA